MKNRIFKLTAAPLVRPVRAVEVSVADRRPRHAVTVGAGGELGAARGQGGEVGGTVGWKMKEKVVSVNTTLNCRYSYVLHN